MAESIPSAKNFPAHAVAIVGLAGRFPDAPDLAAFWRNLRDGVESIETFSDAELTAGGVSAAQRAHPNYVRKGTPLAGAELFDAGFFGLSPREAQVLDPQHRIFLECAVEAMDHAGYGGSLGERSVGVYAGASINTYLINQVLRNPAAVESAGGYQLMLASDKDFLCTRVSYKLDLKGPSMTIQTACSTSLVAVVVAARALATGECDLALAGGVSVSCPQRSGYLYQEGMILSPDGHCRPFDADAGGIRAGSGCGIVVLKRLADALADRDTIHAVIRGAAINNDGAGKAGYTAPSIDGQVEVIATAQALADVDPRSIGYVEAHGTGTPLGDPIEIAALTRVFRSATEDIGFCRLGSLKANLGHLDAAAGVAGLIKTVLALQHKEIPPLVNLRRANPQLALDTSPFSVSAAAAPWEDTGSPRRAGVSSFGIGGTNAHVVVEEAPPLAPGRPERAAHLLVLSAKTPTALDAATAGLADHLAAHPDLGLADVAFTLQVGRRDCPHRRAVVVHDRDDAVARLRAPLEPPVLSGLHEGGTRPVAFLFSGQGSQHAGMGAALYRSEPAYRAAVDRCADLLAPQLGLDIRTVLFAEPGDPAINQTALAQPALFVTEYALATLWMAWGVTPTAMLGHSIGEYVAAHLAGVLSLDDALTVVAARGRLMQALPPGSMAAVHLPPAELARFLADGVEIAAVNGPALCAVSGPTEQVAALLQRLAAAGMSAAPLHTSHAFHSAMMAPALAPFLTVFEGITLSPPAIPYVSNLTGTWITAEQATSPDYYAAHLRQAVQFSAGLTTLAANPALMPLEVGPGSALTAMTRQQLGPERGAVVVSSLAPPRMARPEAEAMREAAGRLWLAGVAIDWAALNAEGSPRRVPLPSYPFERSRFWIDAVSAPAGNAPAVRAGVDAMCYAPAWQRDDTRPAGRLTGAWLVLGGSASLRGAVAAELRAAGAAPILVEAGPAFGQIGIAQYQLRPTATADVAALARHLDGAGEAVSGAIALWAVEEGTPAAGIQDALLALAHGLAEAAPQAPARIIAAASGSASVLDEPLLRPESAAVLGPVLVLPTEIPGLRLRQVDVARADPAAAGALVAEARIAGGEVLAAWRAGRRFVRRFEPLDLPASDATDLPLKPRGVYLITGGLGGLGLTLAGWLARTTAARLLLTARRPLPPRADWDAILAAAGADDRDAAAIRTIRAIEADGGEVMAVAADAADAAAMEAAIAAACDRWGGIDGVIHAAGIPGSGTISLLRDPQVRDAVFAPKVDGLKVLVRLLGDAPLDFVVLMSSINAFVGVPGVCDYSAANAILDAFPESALRPQAWRQVVSIGWEAWRDRGMAAALVVPAVRRAEWQAFLAAAITPAEGTEVFARILACGRSRVVVTPYDLIAADAYVRAPAAPAMAAAPVVPPAPASDPAPATPRSTPTDPPASDTERRLAAIWVELLGIERIGRQDDFFALGGHSLLATRVLARVGDALGVQLALRDVFDAPTLGRLAERIDAAASERSDTQDQDDREEMVF